MGEELTAKSFKSGNSVAIRLPAALGVEPGRQWSVQPEEDGTMVLKLKPRDDARIDLSGIAGSVTGIRRLPFEDRELVWGGSSRNDG